jgi:alginate O-acetyltransferase complex protein AlgI
VGYKRGAVLFPTVAFAVFFCVAFLANWLLRPWFRVWRLALIALSLFFYGYWDQRFVLLLVGSIGLNHAVARAIHRLRQGGAPVRHRRAVLAAGVVLDLGLLGAFKYYGFFVTSAANALNQAGLAVAPPLLDLTLPIGISFFTFQAISYVVDVERGEIPSPLPLLDVAFLMSFFPHLVAGPIVRATDLAHQIVRRPDPRTVPASEAFWLIGLGLFKKVVISSYLASAVVDPVFDVPRDHSRAEVLLAVYGYAVQIYADFSGYTDIAIGCALLLGFRFPQNFDAPYRARSLQEFWQRWHISLSRWIRDYVYIPLGGNRGGRPATYRNLALAMVLAGLWHGAAWTFLIWGAGHALALVGERVLKRHWRPLGLPPGLVAVLQWLTTFHLVCLGWVFFRSHNTGRALELLGQLVEGGPPARLVSIVLLAVVALSIASQFVPDELAARVRHNFAQATPVAQVAILASILTLIDAFGPEGVAPFIYFQF